MTDLTKPMIDEDAAEKLNGYVTDMLALEKHMQTALAGQIEDLDDGSEFTTTLVTLHATCENHVRTLEALTTRREQNVGGVSKAVKKAVSSVLGLGAAAIDFVRTEKLPKDLRDDYTALSLAYVGYVMLHTSALSLGDAEVADTAAMHMRDEAEAMMSLQRIIPAATIDFLRSEGLQADRTVLPTIADSVEASWRST
jgi:ferritin-like metal-binding protein YciE